MNDPNFVWLFFWTWTSQKYSIIILNNTGRDWFNPIPSARGVCLRRARVGSTAPVHLLLAWQIDAASSSVFDMLRRLLPPTTYGNPSRFKPRHHFRTQIRPKYASYTLFSGWQQSWNQYPNETAGKMTSFGSTKAAPQFCDPKECVSGFQNPSVRDGPTPIKQAFKTVW